MKLPKYRLLRAVFRYFGRCSTRSRLRWGRCLGWLAPYLLPSRARIVRTNLALCFPDRSPQDRERWLRLHFRLLAQSVVDRGLCWFGRPAAIKDAIRIKGFEHVLRLQEEGRRVLVIAPHFIALDAAASRMTMEVPESATLYTRQKDPDVDRLVREGRARFNTVHLISRHDGVRGLIRQVKAGVPVYYLPDMDFGLKGGAFVPFFGIPAATLLATSQIAKSFDCAVLMAISRLDIKTGRYLIEISGPLDDFPGDDSPTEAAARINQLIEAQVRLDPPQYYWVHRRFKTRPRGEARFY